MTSAPVLNQTTAMSVPLHVDIGYENDYLTKPRVKIRYENDDDKNDESRVKIG